MSAAPPDSLPRYLVLFDGLCGLCDHTVQWLLSHDRAEVLRFASLQGETAAAVRARHPEVPADLDSILFVEREGEGESEHVYWESRAAFRICARLPQPWRALSWLRVFPRALTDLVYRLVARNRHRLWGRLDACRVPTAEERARFLP